MAINPATGKEDPNYNPNGLIAQAQGQSPAIGVPPDASIMPINPSPIRVRAGDASTPLIVSTPTISDTAKSSTVTAEAAQSGPSELVENRVAGIISSDSPLMQLAQTRAAQQAAGRGLVNSSMAVGAAQDAVLSAATPIASADASSINQNNQFNASNTQQANLQNATQAQRTSELNAASENSAIATNTENQMRTSLANLDVASKAFMAEFEQKNKQMIQSSANAATLFNTFQQQVSAIMTSPNLDLAGKEKAIANLQTMLQDSLAAQDAISGLDLAGILGVDSTGDVAPDTPGNPPASESLSAQQSAWDARVAQIQAEFNSSSQSFSNIAARDSALAALGPRPA